jgi:hypothetical protein
MTRSLLARIRWANVAAAAAALATLALLVTWLLAADPAPPHLPPPILPPAAATPQPSPTTSVEAQRTSGPGGTRPRRRAAGRRADGGRAVDRAAAPLAQPVVAEDGRVSAGRRVHAGAGAGPTGPARRPGRGSNRGEFALG